jgi:hypothetical protein
VENRFSKFIDDGLPPKNFPRHSAPHSSPPWSHTKFVAICFKWARSGTAATNYGLHKYSEARPYYQGALQELVNNPETFRDQRSVVQFIEKRLDEIDKASGG